MTPDRARGLLHVLRKAGANTGARRLAAALGVAEAGVVLEVARLGGLNPTHNRNGREGEGI